MSYQIESLNGCTKKIVFTYENVDLSEQIESALKEKQKSSNLKGFRKGKAPLNFVKQVFGAQIENDALYRFVSQEFYKVIQDEKLRVVGNPAFGNTKYESQNISFDATVEIFPEVTLKDYSSYTFTKGDDSVSDEDVAKLEESYLAQKVEQVEITEDVPVENGMTVIMNFEGEKEDGSRPDNMKAEDFPLEIGSGQFIPGFEDGIVGMKKGDKKTIELTFPSDYHEPDLRDAPVKFHVDILELKKKVLPELSDELVKEIGFESVEEFKTKSKERLVQQKTREVQMKLQEEILNKLIAENPFDVPVILLEQQKQSVKDEMSANFRQQGIDEAMLAGYFENMNDDITTKAEFQLRSGLILAQLSEKYAVEATEADLDAKIAEMAGQSGMEVDQIAQYYKSNEQIKNNIMYAIREEKTFDKLIADMKVS